MNSRNSHCKSSHRLAEEIWPRRNVGIVCGFRNSETATVRSRQLIFQRGACGILGTTENTENSAIKFFENHEKPNYH